MANDDKVNLLDEATQLLTDIALNKSGFTSDHAVRAMEYLAKARRSKPAPQAQASAA